MPCVLLLVLHFRKLLFRRGVGGDRGGILQVTVITPPPLTDVCLLARMLCLGGVEGRASFVLHLAVGRLGGGILCSEHFQRFVNREEKQNSPRKPSPYSLTDPPGLITGSFLFTIFLNVLLFDAFLPDSE